ncbi:MAG: PspC domain-containing protein [Reichenbachiella sp.]
MKKNISINISGIIFHIEEDAYSELKTYLENINRYFSTYEDSLEIVSDIENRIAEIFLTKLNEGKQIITDEDVSFLMTTMGTIADFEAIEEEEPQEQRAESPKNSSSKEKSEKGSSESKSDKETESEDSSDDYDLGKKKLLRDEKRKVLGGVASGIAYYMSIDPLWVRLLLVVLMLNVFNFGISGMILLAYVILWLVIPSSNDLGDEESVKKMFRNSKNQVLGGVASGISVYFGIDLAIVRLLFVASIFLGGSGLILYVILWMITPLAKTITEKMQMQGEPVTLSNIQQSLSNSLKTNEGEESAFAKILLFPFRVLSEVFRVLGKLLGPISKVLLDVIRIFVGIVLTLSGVVAILALLGVLGLLLGFSYGSPDFIAMTPIPVDIIPQSFSPLLYIAGFIAGALPLLVMSLLGVSLIAKRFVINAAMGWSLLGVWLIGGVLLAFSIPSVVSAFSHEGYHKEQRELVVDVNEPVLLKLRDENIILRRIGGMRIKSSEDSVIKLVVKREGFGKSKTQAIENAQMLTYNVAQEGNTLFFDADFGFTDKAKFRGQEINVILYMPLGQVFSMDRDMDQLLSKSYNRELWYRGDLEEEYQWIYEREGLKCLNCSYDEQPNRDTTDSGNIRYYDEEDSQDRKDDVVVSLEDFNELEIHGFYNVDIRQGDEFKIGVNGPRKLTDDVIVNKYDQVLVLDFEKKDWNILEDIKNEGELNVTIYMPELSRVKGTGMCSFDIKGFDSDELVLDFSGATTCHYEGNTKELMLELHGASNIELSGQTGYLVGDVSGASSLRAYKLNAKKVDLKATGASTARVRAKDEMSVKATGLSNIRYKGDPDIKMIDEDGMSTIRSSDD